MGEDNNVEKMFEDMKKKKNKARENVKEDNTSGNTGDRTNSSVIMSKKSEVKHSQYRENLYLSKDIQEKLNSISEETGYSKSEIARKAFKYFFEKLEIK